MPAEFNIDQGAINTELTLPGGSVDRYVSIRMARAVQRARRAAPKRSERLARGINWRNVGRSSDGSRWALESTAPYSLWIHSGRRYSPTAGRVITARAGARPFLEGAVQAEFGR